MTGINSLSCFLSINNNPPLLTYGAFARLFSGIKHYIGYIVSNTLAKPFQRCCTTTDFIKQIPCTLSDCNHGESLQICREFIKVDLFDVRSQYVFDTFERTYWVIYKIDKRTFFITDADPLIFNFYLLHTVIFPLIN